MDWRGFERRPELAPEGAPVEQVFPRAQVAMMRPQLTGFASSFGLKMAFPERIPNTRRVLAMSEYARDQGKLGPFRGAVFDGYWCQRKDLGRDADLRELAARGGLDPDAALAAAADPALLKRVETTRVEFHRKGLGGTPTLFIGNEVITGFQPFEALAAVVRRASRASSQEPGHER